MVDSTNMNDRELDVWIAEHIAKRKWIHAYSLDLNEINDAIRKWCGNNAERQNAFVRAVISVTGLIAYDHMLASARDLCLALVMAAGEED